MTLCLVNDSIPQFHSRAASRSASSAFDLLPSIASGDFSAQCSAMAVGNVNVDLAPLLSSLLDSVLSVCRWINSLISGIQKHKKLHKDPPDSEEGNPSSLL